MGGSDLTLSTSLACFLLAFAPLPCQTEMVSFEMGGFSMAQTVDEENNGVVIQGFPLTDKWRHPPVIRVVQAGVNMRSSFDVEVTEFETEAVAGDDETVRVENVP